MDNTQDEHDLILLEDVVHDAVVADPQPVEGVAGAMHRLHSLPLDAADLRHVRCELLQRPSHTSPNVGLELPEGLRGGRAELDAIRVQFRSSRSG